MNQMTNSHILVHEFEYRQPASLDEATSVLSEYGDRAQILAGGTNLLTWMKMEQVAPECVINIGSLSELEGVSSQDGQMTIGPLTTIQSLLNDPSVLAEHTALAEACAAFGSTQIQIMGTVGGNLCNGSPASDTVPALMALDARLVLVGPDGERALPVEEFLVGPGQTGLGRGELLRSILIPQPRSGSGSAFIKISRVAADLAKVNAAVALVREGDHIIDCRLTFGSVGPTVLRARKAEPLLIDRPFSTELALEAGQAASEEISPIDDVRSTAWYRREVVKALAHDVLRIAWERAGQNAGSRRQDAGGREQEARGRVQEAGGRRPEIQAPRIIDYVSRSAEREIELTVNGVLQRLKVKPNELLLNVLRERLSLTGAKYGCGIGECGACTVLLDGRPTLACLTLAIAAEGCKVLTVEGMEGPNGDLDPLQEAFIEHAAFQCGYCTPGILMMTKHLLEENPSPTEDDIRDHLKGNRCRCTGFASIVRAVKSCAVADG